MKHITLILVLFLHTLPSFAQDGFSLSVSYGIGRGYERGAIRIDSNSYSGAPWKFGHTTTTKVDLNISYTTGHWVLSSGIGYWKDGYTRSQPDYYYYNGLSQVSPGYYYINGNLISLYGYPTLKQTLVYPHITIPFSLGYRFMLSKRFVLTPAIGVVISNNRNTSLRSREDTSGYTYKMTNSEFTRGYKRTSWWATAQLDINYMLTPRWSIFIGPHYASMFTNMVKNSYFTFERSSFKLYDITLNTGITWRLSTPHPKTNEQVQQ